MSDRTFHGIYPMLYAFFNQDGRLDRHAMKRQVEACLAWSNQRPVEWQPVLVRYAFLMLDGFIIKRKDQLQVLRNAVEYLHNQWKIIPGFGGFEDLQDGLN